MDNGVFEVRSMSGDTHLGGEDFDHGVMDYVIKFIKKKYNKDISKDPRLSGNFERNMDLFKKIMRPVKKALEDAGLKKKDIHEIVLVGGSTRIPKVQEMLKDFFDGKEPSKGVNPDKAVAYSAAVQGGVLSGEGGEETKGNWTDERRQYTRNASTSKFPTSEFGGVSSQLPREKRALAPLRGLKG
ncbi:hypothetical protein ACFX15_032708 [Malus domestica]